MHAWSNRWVGAVVLVVSFVGAAVTIPIAVERYAAEQARQRAAQVPGAYEWEETEWFWGRRLTLRNFEAKLGSRGFLRAERLDIDFAANSLFTLSPVIQGLSVRGLRAEIDVGGAEKADRVESNGDRSGAADRIELPERFEKLTSLRISDGRIEVLRSSHTIATLEGGFHLDSNRTASGSGRLTLPTGSSSNRVAWRFEGSGSVPERSLSGELHLSRAAEQQRDQQKGDGTGPAVLQAGPIGLELGGLSVDLSGVEESVAGTVVLREFSASVGDGDQTALEASGPELTVALEGDSPIHLRGSSLDTVVAPRNVLGVFGPGGDERGDRSGTSSSSSARPVGSEALFDRIRRRVLSEVDLSLDELGLEIRVRDDGTWKSYRPSERVRVRKRGRVLSVAGGFAGGRVDGRAQFPPGSLVPRSAELRMREVHLGEIPVVKKGRSLPSRGVRGKIGGEVDLTAGLLRRGTPGTLRERFVGNFELEWSDGWVEADGLARDPVRGIDASIGLAADWEPALNRLRLRESRLEFGAITVGLNGRLVDWGFEPHLALKASFDEIECQRAVRSLPRELLGPYRRVAIEGRAAPVVDFDYPVDRPEELTFDVADFPGPCRVEALNAEKSGWPDLVAVASPPVHESGIRTATETAIRHWAAPPEPSYPIGPPATLEAIPSDWSPSRPDDVFWLRKPFVSRVTEGVDPGERVEVGPGLESYVPLEALPTYVSAAAYLSEEVDFYDGGPWNTKLLQKALRMNFGESRFVYGGSTVTQQLVKNLFLTRQKTLARKIQEALISWRIQGVVSKDRVLELYLNCIEYGNNVYGIGPAARHYFQKPASQLSLLEGVFLAVLKPAPWYGDKFKERGTTPESGWWRSRIGEIIERLVDKGFVDEKRAERAKPYVLKWDDEGEYLPEKPVDEAGLEEDFEQDAPAPKREGLPGDESLEAPDRAPEQ